MKRKIIFVTLAALTIAACNKKSGSAKKVALKTQQDSFAYAFGATFGGVLKSSNVKEIDWEIFKAATEFVMKNGDSLSQISREDIDRVLNEYMTMSKYGENLKKGTEFMAKNKSAYTTTASGLMYKVISKGTELKPTITDTVLVNYKGKFINGETFDSNEGKGAVKFALNGGAVKGFLEALNTMTVGSKYEVIIPQNLAYGKRGKQVQNPYTGEPMMIMEPYQTLIFEIELLEIKK